MATRSIVMEMTFGLAVLAASCESSSRTAPFGLESITQPEGSDQIGAVLTAMPRTLRGLEANEPTMAGSQLGISYGDDRDLALQAMDLSAREGGSPATTVGEFLPMFAESGEVDVDESHLKGSLIWFTGENHALNQQGEIVQTFWQTWWGAPSSAWVFVVNAPSEEDGVALVQAFVETASPE